MQKISDKVWDRVWRTCDECDREVRNHSDINHYGNEHNIFFSICAKCDEDRDISFVKELN